MKSSVSDIFTRIYKSNISGRSIFVWNTVLVNVIFFCTFIIPVFPHSWGRTPFRIGFTLIFVAGVMSLGRKNARILYLSVFAIIMEWVSGVFDWDLLSNFSRLVNILFFLFVIVSLLHEMATAKVVTPRVIMGSISGYLLIGLIYSVAIAVIIQHDPGAFNVVVDRTGNDATYQFGTSLYYGFVTLATLGYGDIVPLKPYSRSLAILISVTGQLYVATIIGILIGKYVAATHHVHSHKDENPQEKEK